jgi:hypothetical protein
VINFLLQVNIPPKGISLTKSADIAQNSPDFKKENSAAKVFRD